MWNLMRICSHLRRPARVEFQQSSRLGTDAVHSSDTQNAGAKVRSAGSWLTIYHAALASLWAPEDKWYTQQSPKGRWSDLRGS